MSIIINRNTGWPAWYLRIQIIINGKKANVINENQSIEVQLPSDKASLKVRQFGVKSNEVVVKAGDILEIKTTWWYKILVPVMIVIQVLTLFVTYLEEKLTSLLSLGVFVIIVIAFILSIFLKNGFYIKIINKIIDKFPFIEGE